MFLKGFKEKSNQKFINKLIESRKSSLSQKNVESVVIVLSLGEYDDFEAFRVFFGDLGFNPNKIKLAGFTEDAKQVLSSIELLYSQKDIGWKGKVKNNELETFINSEFDALISYYKQDNLELNLITARSKAKFKIGISDYDERLNDLIIDVKPKEIDLFEKELIKYLTILKKL